MNSKLKNFIILPLLLGIIELSQAQDIVFSQFKQVASYYNPAYAGFEREVGAGMMVRNQWGNTRGNYFQTYIFGDAYLEEYKSGAGLDLSYQDANSGGNTTLSLAARYNYHLELNKKWTSAVGLSAGYTSIKMNPDKLIFADQLNTNTNSTATAENIGAIENRGYLDIGIGTVFYVEQKTEISLGIKHINFPSLKSLNDERTPIKPMISMYLKHRIKVAGSFYRPNSKKVYLSPSLLFLNQAQFSQIKLGTAVEVELVTFGMYYRTGLGKLDGIYSKNDALILMGGINTESFNMTYSYDMNISAQRLPTNSHELSLIYIKKSNKVKGMKRVKKRRR